MKKLVIFDCDGTLADTEILNNQATLDVLIECGFTNYDMNFCMQELVGKTMSVVKVMIEEREGRKLPDDFILRFIELVSLRMKDGLLPVSGAVESAQYIDQHFLTCVASNGERANVMESLRAIGLFDLFGENRIFTKIQVPRGKPYPDIFFYAAQKMGCLPEESVVIEDSVSGVQAGVAAGMQTIGITAVSHDREAATLALKGAGASQVFENWEDIRNYINVFVDD